MALNVFGTRGFEDSAHFFVFPRRERTRRLLIRLETLRERTPVNLFTARRMFLRSCLSIRLPVWPEENRHGTARFHYGHAATVATVSRPAVRKCVFE